MIGAYTDVTGATSVTLVGVLPRRRLRSSGGGPFGPVRVDGREREGHGAKKGPGFGQQVRTRFPADDPRRGDESCRPKQRAGPLGAAPHKSVAVPAPR